MSSFETYGAAFKSSQILANLAGGQKRRVWPEGSREGVSGKEDQQPSTVCSSGASAQDQSACRLASCWPLVDFGKKMPVSCL